MEKVFVCIIEDETNTIIKKIDVSGKSERMREKTLSGVLNRINLEFFDAEILTESQIKKYNNGN